MSRPRSRRLVATLFLSLAASQFACATGAQRLVKGGVEGGVGGALEALNDPHNKQLLRQLLQDKDIKDAAHDLTEAITGGAMEGLTEPQRQAELRAATDKFISTVAGCFAFSLGEDNTIARARLAYGGVAAMPARARKTEAALIGGLPFLGPHFQAYRTNRTLAAPLRILGSPKVQFLQI